MRRAIAKATAYVVLSLCLLSSFSNSFCARPSKLSSRQERVPARIQLFDTASPTSQLEQLASYTTLAIDSGNVETIRQYVTDFPGCITDATTNPLLVAQAALAGDAYYTKLLDSVVAETLKAATAGDDVVTDAMNRWAVRLGSAIAEIVPGRVSTEVDPRLSFDTEASVAQALRLAELYQRVGGIDPKERVLIKLAATWEGIQAAECLERDHGLKCNLTLLFSTVQAEACAQHGVTLISPFPGRILDWHHLQHSGRKSVADPDDDEGVQACRTMQEYFVANGYDTICMPASWRPSRGPGYELDEIRALAGVDRMTIPPALLEQLAAANEPLPRRITMNKRQEPAKRPAKMTETEFRFRVCMDGCSNDKLAEGIRAFVQQTEQLERLISSKVNELSGVAA